MKRGAEDERTLRKKKEKKRRRESEALTKA